MGLGIAATRLLSAGRGETRCYVRFAGLVLTRVPAVKEIADQGTCEIDRRKGIVRVVSTRLRNTVAFHGAANAFSSLAKRR